MDTLRQFQENVFTVTPENFETSALALFRWQAHHNEIYRRYIAALDLDPASVQALSQIPFLPIDFFKRHQVLSTTNHPVEVVFESSGTTGQIRSRHYLTNLAFYQRVSQYIFEQRFGPLSSYHIIALLPSYLERKNASLVAMADYFIRQSDSPYSGFYLDDYESLFRTLAIAQRSERQVLLIGVTFALLTLAEYDPDLTKVAILETGGMKGMQKEMIREEVYGILKNRTGAQQFYSEYGMTELLSQAYSNCPGIFRAPPWMRLLTREIDDPFVVTELERSGGINVIDLANAHSCAFIETMDQGRVYSDQTFEILGRLDHSDARGCNTMVTHE